MGTTIAVIGAGPVGLSTGVCLAHVGHTVRCVEKDPSKVDALNAGQPTIYEEGLAELLAEGLESHRLRFYVSPIDGVTGAHFVFICVPTPGGPNGSADVTALEAVCRDVGPHLLPGAVVVNKSTLPIGSTDVVARSLQRDDVRVVSNPEFLREGSAISDGLHPTRIVIGATDREVAAGVAELFRNLDAPILLTDPATAEMIKYASNAFLATRLSFVNATANVCEALGTNVEELFVGMGYDPRIGLGYLDPGPGWGGSCLPKDTQALALMAREAGVKFSLLEEVIRSNDEHIDSIVQKVRRAVGGSVEDVLLGAWGLAFKAGTDDRRNSPAVEVLSRLRDEGSRIRVFDPTTVGQQVEELPGVAIVGDAYAACEEAQALVILTEWDEFRSMDLRRLSSVMSGLRIVDARNLLDPGTVRSFGFSYVGVGRT